MSAGIHADLISFADGHTPGASDVDTRLAVYRRKQSKNFFCTFDNFLPSLWCNRAYQYAVQRSKPWGAYVTTEDALNCSIVPEDLWVSGQKERALSLISVRELLFEKGSGIVGKDKEAIHGTAVWCLSSKETDSVQYHIDYAELYRYETNIIYPPLYAGTWQVSPVETRDARQGSVESQDGTTATADMIGGDFMANMGGIEHYRRFGYKGKLATQDAWEADLRSTDWLTTRYRRNRATLHDGDFPHLATEVKYIKPGLRRVILGFNAFPAAVGECCIRAPEHSDAFNRTIKLYQTMASLGVPITTTEDSAAQTDSAAVLDGSIQTKPIESSSVDITLSSEANESSQPQPPLPQQQQQNKQQLQYPQSGCDRKAGSKGGINVKDVMKNPALAKLLVNAAKKVKAEQQMKQQEQLQQQNEQQQR